MSALLPGGAAMMVCLPSSETNVTPRPGVRPKLPFTVEQEPVRAGLFLQVISAASALEEARHSKSVMACLTIAHLLQGFSRRLRQEQDGDQRNRNGCQETLQRGPVAAQPRVTQP